MTRYYALSHSPMSEALSLPDDQGRKGSVGGLRAVATRMACSAGLKVATSVIFWPLEVVKRRWTYTERSRSLPSEHQEQAYGSCRKRNGRASRCGTPNRQQQRAPVSQATRAALPYDWKAAAHLDNQCTPTVMKQQSEPHSARLPCTHDRGQVVLRQCRLSGSRRRPS